VKAATIGIHTLADNPRNTLRTANSERAPRVDQRHEGAKLVRWLSKMTGVVAVQHAKSSGGVVVSFSSAKGSAGFRLASKNLSKHGAIYRVLIPTRRGLDILTNLSPTQL
jgi:hypothetical protein